jgi:putative copper export protein
MLGAPDPAGSSDEEAERVLEIGVDEVRVFLHLLAAAVWVGGQIVLAALVPVLKRLGPEVPRAVAQQFGRVAWPAFAVLIATGIWNLVAIGDAGDAYRRTLEVKLVVVLLSGVTAWLHARATSRRGMAVFGALTGLTALLALFLGVVLG